MKFGRLSKMIENAKALSLEGAFRYTLSDKSITDYIIQLNTDEQLFEGVDSQGRQVGTYSEYTEKLNQGQSFGGKAKIAGEPWFFYDTGGFFNSFYIKVEKDSFVIIATDADKMQDLFGDIESIDILIGLTPESRELLKVEILPKIREYVLKQLLS